MLLLKLHQPSVCHVSHDCMLLRSSGSEIPMDALHGLAWLLLLLLQLLLLPHLLLTKIRFAPRPIGVVQLRHYTVERRLLAGPNLRLHGMLHRVAHGPPERHGSRSLHVHRRTLHLWLQLLLLEPKIRNRLVMQMWLLL